MFKRTFNKRIFSQDYQLSKGLNSRFFTPYSDQRITAEFSTLSSLAYSSSELNELETIKKNLVRTIPGLPQRSNTKAFVVSQTYDHSSYESPSQLLQVRVAHTPNSVTSHLHNYIGYESSTYPGQLRLTHIPTSVMSRPHSYFSYESHAYISYDSYTYLHATQPYLFFFFLDNRTNPLKTAHCHMFRLTRGCCRGSGNRGLASQFKRKKRLYDIFTSFVIHVDVDSATSLAGTFPLKIQDYSLELLFARLPPPPRPRLPLPFDLFKSSLVFILPYFPTLLCLLCTGPPPTFLYT